MYDISELNQKFGSAGRIAFRVSQNGMNKLIVWNPWIKKSIQLKDFGDTEYKSMLTVAPATLPVEKMILQPGKKVTVETSIQAALT